MKDRDTWERAHRAVHGDRIPEPLHPWVYVMLAALAGVCAALALCYVFGGI